MTALPSTTRALTLAALVIVSTFAVVATPAIVSGQASDEPNDTRANATRIDTNEFVEGGIDEAGGTRDVDWYRLDVAPGNHVRVVSAEGYGVGSSYTLYGPDGEALGAGGEYGTEDAPVVGTADAAGGTYYLEVTVDDAFAGESYGFSVETVTQDGFEPNDERDDAAPLEPGTARSGVVAAGDVDRFAVSVAAGETLDATLSLADARSLGYVGSNDVDLDIYDPVGKEVGENPEDVATNNAPADQTSRFDGRFEVTQRTVTEESGTYYVRVTGVDTTGFTSYDLTTAVSSANDGDGSDGANGSDDDDGRNENGSDDGERPSGDEGATGLGNATAVDSPSAIGNGRIDADGNVDTYAFEMREGSQVELMQGIGGGAYPVTVLDENGAVLGRIGDQETYNGEEDLLRVNASYTGTYYLTIDGAPGDRYSILGSVTEPDANEPNDGRETATAIGADGADRGTIVRGDVDYYALQVDAGETVDVFANSTAAAALTVSGPSGSAIDSQEVPSRFDPETGTPVTSVTADESGTYYLEFALQSNAIGRVNGEYAIELRSVGRTDGGQSGDGEPSDRAGDDGTADDQNSNAAGPDAGDETSTERSTSLPTEQASGETSSGSATATADANTEDTASAGSTTAPSDATGRSDGTSTAEDDDAAENGDCASDATPGDDATTTVLGTDGSGSSGGGSETANSDTSTAGDEAGEAADAAASDGTATSAERAGTTSEASATENASNGDPGSVGTTENGERTDEPDGTAPSGGAEKTAVDGPGFGLLAALLAVLGVGAFALGHD